jgi:hypothetical protein
VPFAAVHEFASGTKRTYRVALHMSAFGVTADKVDFGPRRLSAFDPKRTISGRRFKCRVKVSALLT